MWLLGNRTLWKPGIGRGLWISGENTSVHSVPAKLQPTATVYQEREDCRDERNLNILSPTQLLKENGIDKALCLKLERLEGGKYERHDGLQVFFVWEGQICSLQAPSAYTPHIFTVAAEQRFTDISQFLTLYAI